MKKIIDYIYTSIDKIKNTKKIIPVKDGRLENPATDKQDAYDVYISENNKWETINQIENSKYNIRDFLKFWVIWLVVVYIWYISYGVIDTIYLMILWYILSIAMESYIMWIVNKWRNRLLAIFLSYIWLVGIILTWILIIVPFLAGQISDIVEILLQYFTTIQWYISEMWVLWYINSLDIPEYIKFYIKEFSRDPQYIQTLQDMLLGSINGILKQWSSYVWNAWILVLWTVKNFASALFQISLVFTAAVLFSIDQENILSYINKVTNSRAFSAKIKKIYTKIWYWLKSQLLLCLFIFITVYSLLLVLEIFGISVPNKLSIALISWLTEIIPYIWPFIWAIPWIMVWTISEWRMWFVVLSWMYFLVQRVENNIFIPALMNKTLGVSPSLMFVCMLLLSMIMWITGIIMAIPISIIISVMAE